jgi:hypothetical protein
MGWQSRELYSAYRKLYHSREFDHWERITTAPVLQLAAIGNYHKRFGEQVTDKIDTSLAIVL